MADETTKSRKKDEGSGSALRDAQEQGFIGTAADPTPNEAFSVQSGPDSPTAAEQAAIVRERETEAAAASQGS